MLRVYSRQMASTGKLVHRSPVTGHWSLTTELIGAVGPINVAPPHYHRHHHHHHHLVGA
uniref:HDC02522 n=1 Tax=Drosophila melanogaster TaxID=7227 RepID=Q6IHI9_DROME|nr:TPA_inf: HDC02522 [Drosophila melanogaster]